MIKTLKHSYEYIRLSLVMFFLIILLGCSKNAIYVPVNLVYPSPSATDKINYPVTIYIQRPISKSITKTTDDIEFHKTYKYNINIDKINEIKRLDDSFIIGQANLSLDGSLKILYATNDNVLDWVAGALGTELQNKGYNINYVNKLTDDTNNNIVMTINEVKVINDYLSRVMCRSNININFKISKGNITKNIILHNEHDAEFNKWSIASNRIPYCTTESLRDNLQKIMMRAVIEIIKIMEEA